MREIRVLIVDDSATVRSGLRRLLEEDGAIRVRAAVPDAFAAAEHMRKELPDVLLLDLELPRMDGLTFLQKIMEQRPIPVIVCSSHTDSGSRAALRALELGASEVVGKPRLSTPAERQEAQIRLCDAIRAAAQAAGKRTAPPPLSPGPKLTADVILAPPRPGARTAGPQPLIAIGASTGGTEALARVLPALAPDSPATLIVQHMPEKFTAAFARRLNALCDVQVAEARSGDRPAPGTVLIAPGDRHMILRRQGRGYLVEIAGGPYVARHRPSVDVLFRSAAIAAGRAGLGVLMTGMGDDGARGLVEMREAGAETLVQDEASSIVWGMPGEAMRLGGARRAVTLDRIPHEIAAFSERGHVA
ncbi:protein-glutamate methylesterase/protein-glutamine glutaminase [Tranquillimonas rosea]|uniref:protein-glutamate methylesterase/protein-glutamine glutaminase n=1 Tax=Tranquillimonas rosea TaxID=641238 RepID=UPI003BA8C296